MSGNKADRVIIDDPADVSALRQAHVIPHDAPRVVLDPAELAPGPLDSHDGHRALEQLHLEHERSTASTVPNELPVAPPPPDRYQLTSEVSAGELRALRWVLGTIKPNTNIGRAAIAGLNRLIGSKVAL